MEMDPQIPVELIKAIAEQNKNPVRIEKNLVQQNLAKDKTKSYTVQLGSSTLILSKTNESPISEAYKKQIVDQLCQMEQQKKLYNQLVTEEPLGGSKDTVNQIRGGDLGKGSSPGARARSDARKAITNRTKGPKAAKSKPGGSPFAEAFTVEPKFLARPGQNGLFGRFSPRPTPDPFNPGCAGGPRSITVLSQSKSSEQDSAREITAHDGVKGRLTDKSTNHLTSKHGGVLGIDDPLPPNPNQKPTKYKQIRTRVNKENKEKFGDIIEEILKDPTTEPYSDVSMRGIKGHGYYTENYGESGFFVGIHTEGEFAGQSKKAQPLTPEQLENLRTLNSIN
jgi:hypothetical protein